MDQTLGQILVGWNTVFHCNKEDSDQSKWLLNWLVTCKLQYSKCSALCVCSFLKMTQSEMLHSCCLFYPRSLLRLKDRDETMKLNCGGKGQTPRKRGQTPHVQQFLFEICVMAGWKRHAIIFDIRVISTIIMLVNWMNWASLHSQNLFVDSFDVSGPVEEDGPRDQGRQNRKWLCGLAAIHTQFLQWMYIDERLENVWRISWME